jgi:hypothetical protein
VIERFFVVCAIRRRIRGGGDEFHLDRLLRWRCRCEDGLSIWHLSCRKAFRFPVSMLVVLMVHEYSRSHVLIAIQYNNILSADFQANNGPIFRTKFMESIGCYKKVTAHQATRSWEVLTSKMLSLWGLE